MSQNPGKQSWSFTDIYDFSTVNPSGYGPNAPVLANSGKIYVSSPQAIIELTPPKTGHAAWTGTTIWTATRTYSVFMGVLIDLHGNLFVSDTFGGPPNSYCDGSGCGEVFELVPPQAPGNAWA